MTRSEIAQLARVMAERGVVRLEIDACAERYVLVTGDEPPSEAGAGANRVAGASDGIVVAAMAPGRFRTVHPVRLVPEVSPGMAVKAGQILGFLEGGDAVLPVLAPQDGTFRETLAPDGAIVGYGTPLLRLSR